VIRQLAAIVLLGGSIARGGEPAGVAHICRYWAEYYARVYQVPVELVDAVIEVESDWNPYAVSSKGAAGLMQLMPGTAVRFGVWNRFHVQENIRAGVAYLAWLIHLFHGDLRLATAAYLVGESRVESRGLAYSSPEVYSYVSRVAHSYRARRLNSMQRGGTAEEVER
jgi:soluble lytic murein transglycosylase-like protein